MAEVKAMNLPELKYDSIDRYIEQINKFPVLSPEEEYELAKRVREDNDIEAAKKLVLANLRFVVKIANEYRKLGFPLKDLIQEGNLGLLKAVKKFDPDKGCRKFISYAVWWIRAQIHEYILRTWSMVKLGTTQLQKKIFYKFSKVVDAIDGEQFIEQIADDYHVDKEKIIEIKNRFENNDVSLDNEIDDNGKTFINFIESNYKSPEEEAIENEKEEILKEKLWAALDVLNDRERYIIMNRYLTEEPKTLQEIGDEFGITRERVRQIEKRALEKIKKQLPPELQLLAA